eukprot:g7858.t1
MSFAPPRLVSAAERIQLMEHERKQLREHIQERGSQSSSDAEGESSDGSDGSDVAALPNAQRQQAPRASPALLDSEGRRGTVVRREIAHERATLRKHLQDASHELEYEAGRQHLRGEQRGGVAGGGGARNAARASVDVAAAEQEGEQLMSLSSSGVLPLSAARAGRRRPASPGAASSQSLPSPSMLGGAAGGGDRGGRVLDAAEAHQRMLMSEEHKRQAEELATTLAAEVQRLRAQVQEHDTRAHAERKRLRAQGAGAQNELAAREALLKELRADNAAANERLNAERTQVITLRAALAKAEAQVREQAQRHERALVDLRRTAEKRADEAAGAKVELAKLSAERTLLARELQEARAARGAAAEHGQEAEQRAQLLTVEHKHDTQERAHWQAEREAWREERQALREAHRQVQSAKAGVQARLERRTERLRRARQKCVALQTELSAAQAAADAERQQRAAADDGARIAQAATAATAAALRESSFAEQTCARVEQLLVRAQLQQQQQAQLMHSQHLNGLAQDPNLSQCQPRQRPWQPGAPPEAANGHAPPHTPVSPIGANSSELEQHLNHAVASLAVPTAAPPPPSDYAWSRLAAALGE